jgi:hypothetical protein
MVASVLKEVMMMGLQNPQAPQMLGLNIKWQQVFTQLLMNYGIRNTTDFVDPPLPPEVQAMVQQMMAAQAPGGRGIQATAMPDAQLTNEVAKGNLQPFAPTGGGNGRTMPTGL